MKQARRTGKRLLRCPLSIKQKAQALGTFIDSCMAKSMPLDLMTMSDISKCDAIKLKTCKRLYKIPRSTLSAMIHHERDRAGLSPNFEECDVCQPDMYAPDKSSA